MCVSALVIACAGRVCALCLCCVCIPRVLNMCLVCDERVYLCVLGVYCAFLRARTCMRVCAYVRARLYIYVYVRVCCAYDSHSLPVVRVLCTCCARVMYHVYMSCTVCTCCVPCARVVYHVRCRAVFTSAVLHVGNRIGTHTNGHFNKSSLASRDVKYLAFSNVSTIRLDAFANSTFHDQRNKK